MEHDADIIMENEPKGFALSGKIMLSAIIILFAVVIFMVVLHLYARWYIFRERRRELHRRRNRVNQRARIAFYVDNEISSPVAVNRGLAPCVLSSLPIFIYSSKNRSEVMECAVCLSEFENDDKGRLLPKCNHSFHIECIDMWFHSHSSCPLCRSAVEPVLEAEKKPLEMESSAGESMEVQAGPVESGSSSGLCSTYQHDEGRGSLPTTSLGSRRKGFDLSAVRIEVPRTSELENELEPSSPASHGFRSPGTRLLSIKRILSMSRKSPATVGAASAGAGTNFADSFRTGLDLESGFTREQTRSQAQTPR